MPDFNSVAQQLLFHLARTPGPIHRDELAEAVGTSKDYAGRTLSKMVKRGRIERVGRGTYDLPTKSIA